MIKKETILSNYDNKLTLLQWLKTLDKNISELQEKGVDMHLLVFNSAQEFYEYFKKLGSGTSSFMPFLINTDDLYIYAFGESIFNDNGAPESPEGDVISVYGMIGTIDANSDEGRFAMGGTIVLAEVDGKVVIDSVDPRDYWYSNEYQLNQSINAIKNTTNFKLLTKDFVSGATTNQFLADYKNAFGLGNYKTGNYVFGHLTPATGLHKWNVQGFITKGDEIYYPTGTATLDWFYDDIENAVSGTQLKEAVRLANQKTYWHTINLHNSGTLSDVHITIVIPSHSNNPVANAQDLLAIGAGDTWGCSGTIATTESALPIVTFDGVKFGATADATIFSGTLGRTYTLSQLIAKSLEYSDNVKEVK